MVTARLSGSADGVGVAITEGGTQSHKKENKTLNFVGINQTDHCRIRINLNQIKSVRFFGLGQFLAPLPIAIAIAIDGSNPPQQLLNPKQNLSRQCPNKKFHNLRVTLFAIELFKILKGRQNISNTNGIEIIILSTLTNHHPQTPNDLKRYLSQKKKSAHIMKNPWLNDLLKD